MWPGLELTDILVELFKNTPQEIISNIVYLIQGKLLPDFEGVELGVAEKLAIRAISKSFLNKSLNLDVFENCFL